VLPLARKVAAGKNRSVEARCFALGVIARFGTPADLPTFEALFADAETAATVSLADYSLPGVKAEGKASAEVRDVALALALVLLGEDPAEHGFVLARAKTDINRNPVHPAALDLWRFGFREGDDAARRAAHAKARAWLDDQKKKAAADSGAREEPEPTPGLLRDLDELDQMRQGEQTDFAAVEKRGAELLAKYPAADHGRIYFTLTRVYSNSGIGRTHARVTRYGRLTLERERDPVRRGLIFSDLASASEVATTSADPLADNPFPVKRRRAAAVVLEGYRELLPLKLPAVAPELPAVEKPLSDAPALDQIELAKQRERHAAQVRARREAEFVREMVHRRDTYAAQLAYLYGREPKAGDELKELITEGLRDPNAAADLLDRVTSRR
jgi:hypothetical protein